MILPHKGALIGQQCRIRRDTRILFGLTTLAVAAAIQQQEQQRNNNSLQHYGLIDDAATPYSSSSPSSFLPYARSGWELGR